MIEAGIHDIPMSAYLADPCPEPSLSTGIVAALAQKSPAHARYMHPALGKAPREATTRTDIGSAVHARILGGAHIVYLPYDDWRKQDAQDERDAAYRAGDIPLLRKHQDMVENTAASATRYLNRAIGVDRVMEQTLVWQHEAGVWCRSRPDIIYRDKRLVVDVKTCSDAAPAEWIRRSLWASNYDLQAALVLDGLYSITGFSHDFIFLAVEIDPPYACSLVGVGATMLDIANAKLSRAAALWRTCLDDQSWPMYSDEIVYAEPPAWALWDHEHAKDAA